MRAPVAVSAWKPARAGGAVFALAGAMYRARIAEDHPLVVGVYKDEP